jgi:hypothetical protein
LLHHSKTFGLSWLNPFAAKRELTMSRIRILFAALAAFLALPATFAAKAQPNDWYANPPLASCGAASPYYGSQYNVPGYNGAGAYGAGYYSAGSYGAGSWGSGGCGARAYAGQPAYGASAYYGSAYGNCGCRSVEIFQQTAVAPISPGCAPCAPVSCSPCAPAAPAAYGSYAPYAPGYDGSAMAACAARFRSFDPASGTYLSYSGVRLLCPYLGG